MASVLQQFNVDEIFGNLMMDDEMPWDNYLPYYLICCKYVLTCSYRERNIGNIIVIIYFNYKCKVILDTHHHKKQYNALQAGMARNKYI